MTATQRENVLTELVGRAVELMPADTAGRLGWVRDAQHALDQFEASLVKPLRVPTAEENERGEELDAMCECSPG